MAQIELREGGGRQKRFTLAISVETLTEFPLSGVWCVSIADDISQRKSVGPNCLYTLL